MLSRRHLYLPWIAAAVVVVLAACGTDEPSRAPSEAQVVTTAVSAPRYVVLTSFEELAEEATAIVIGTGTGQRESQTHQGRDPNNPSQLDPNYAGLGVAYQVEVERYLKGAGPDVLSVYQSEGSLTTHSGGPGVVGVGVPGGSGTVSGNQVRTVSKAAEFPIREGVRYLFFLEPMTYYPDLMTGVAHPPRFVLDGGTASPDGPWEGASEYFPTMPESDLIDTVEEIVLAVSMASARAGGTSEAVYRSLAETGADFAPAFGEARDATFTPALAKERAVEIAADEFMRGFDLPAGRGIESRIDARAVTAIFSGSSDSFSRTWDVVEREVWVVSLWDLPIRIPCGGTIAGGCPDSVDPPHFTLAVDARTGEIVGFEMAGAGGMSSTWDRVDLRPASVAPPVTPTPFPTATTVASSMDNPKRIVPAIVPTTAVTPSGSMATPEPTSTPATLEREQRTATPAPVTPLAGTLYLTPTPEGELCDPVLGVISAYIVEPAAGAVDVPLDAPIVYLFPRPLPIARLRVIPETRLKEPRLERGSPGHPPASLLGIVEPVDGWLPGTTYRVEFTFGQLSHVSACEHLGTVAQTFTTAP